VPAPVVTVEGAKRAALTRGITRLPHRACLKETSPGHAEGAPSRREGTPRRLALGQLTVA
jgi:hypothetical protein